MSYTINEIKDNIAYCGLVCKLCSEGKAGRCSGCRQKSGGCSIKTCAEKRKLNGCWECSDYPCGEGMFNSRRSKVFLKCAKEEGVHSLAAYLKKNADEGIQYHKEDGSIGDYDALGSEAEIYKLLRRKADPFISCPVYETDNLLFSKVREQDAEELFGCYSDPVTVSHMNNDNCSGNWNVCSVEIVREAIRAWESEYDAKFFIRWSVTHKETKAIIGTIELAPIPNATRFFDVMCKTGILRADILSSYEKEEIFSEIYKMARDNFHQDFEIKNIVTKAIKDDRQRTLALKNSGFEKCEDKGIIRYSNYYIETSY